MEILVSPDAWIEMFIRFHVVLDVCLNRFQKNGNRSQKPEARNQKAGNRKLLQDRAHHHPHPDIVVEDTGMGAGAGGDAGVPTMH